MHRCFDAASALSSAAGLDIIKQFPPTPLPPAEIATCSALGSTGVLLACLHNAFPVLPVVGLVDWNPSGVAILAIYKMGSTRMGLESTRQACMTDFCTSKPCSSNIVWGAS